MSDHHHATVRISYEQLAEWAAQRADDAGRLARELLPLRRAALTPAPQDQQAEAVRAHIQKMQSYVREYLEPGPYVAKHSEGGTFNEPHPHQDEAYAYFMRQQMREAVLNDLIYMLDGPEERAALDHPAPQDQQAEAVVPQGLTSDKAGLGRFGHHPDPAIDFCIEVETLDSRLHQAENGLSKPGTDPEKVLTVLKDIERAMSFTVGGDEGAVLAKHHLRKLEDQARGSAHPAPQAEATPSRDEALRAAMRRARTLIDRALGDSDPHDPDHPLLLACQTLSAALEDRT